MTTSIISRASDGGLGINGVEAVTFNAGGVADKIRTIDATVASNAITVTLAPCVLDFRSETLTSGAITQVINNATLSLTIAATDSFGAVTADGVQRLYILVINNAGVMELAATRAAGGVNLNEEGVITTAATSTTATGIKGVGVRTGKAYHVVGCIDAPFTTAVGWGAITLKQGYGGQALAAMSSLGYGQTWQNVTGSRALNTTYYNTTGKPITINLATTNTGASSGARLTVNGVVILGHDPVTATTGFVMVLNTIVPPNNSYIALDTAQTLTTWNELR